MELRDVAAFGQRDDEGIALPFIRVVPLQSVSQARGFGTDDGVSPRIEGRAFAQNVCADRVFLEAVGVAIGRVLDQIAQQFGGPVRALEHGAGQDLAELREDGFTRNSRHVLRKRLHRRAAPRI